MSVGERLYIFIFLHQTTTDDAILIGSGLLYIFIFLHQTTTLRSKNYKSYCCISLYSYIKPQLWSSSSSTRTVVYLYIPTSNHNGNSTDNSVSIVVYLYIPTSNHNAEGSFQKSYLLYIFIFLHQTTTKGVNRYTHNGCISLYSYIKPQLSEIRDIQYQVVYLYIPTSNHNSDSTIDINPQVVYLYIPTSNHNLKKRIY